MRYRFRASALSILFLAIGWVPAPEAAYAQAPLPVKLEAGTAAATEAETGIFTLDVELFEWQVLEQLLGDYFDRLADSGYSEDRFAVLAATLSEQHRVQLTDVSLTGYYNVWQDRVYVDKRLFRGLVNRVYAMSVIHHEKIHERQCKRLDRLFLLEDQMRRYSEKLEEIAAHYGQIRWVLGTGDASALGMVLANSYRLGIFPGLLRSYTADDPVVLAVRRFTTNTETP